MFLFVAGVQPKIRVLDDAPRACPSCGRVARRRQRVDHMLSVFFVPLFPVKRGEPFFACTECGAAADGDGDEQRVSESRRSGHCRACGRRLERDFVHCPGCGNRV